MGCGVSKDDIAEPRPMQPHGRDKFLLTGKSALKPIQVNNARDSTCISSLSIPSSEIINKPSSPPSVIVHTPDSLSSDDEDESDLDPSYVFSSKQSIQEVDHKASTTTALAALSREKSRRDREDAEEQVKGMLAVDELLSTECSQEISTCALEMLSGAAIFQALMSSSPVIMQQHLGDDLSRSRVGRVAVISGPEPIRWEPPMRKAEIIDLDEEPDAGVVHVLEGVPAKQEDQADQEQELANPAEPPVPDLEQENSDEDSVASLIEQRKQQDPKLDETFGIFKTLSAPEPRKSKLPPLSIVPPILVKLPAHPFGKPAFPVVVKPELLEVKGLTVLETAQFEDLSAPTPTREAANGDNHDMSESSTVAEHEEGTPTPATKSSANSEWRSPHHDIPDSDIEDIVLVESQELDSLPLLPTLDCHGIHMDKKDLISPSLRLIS